MPAWLNPAFVARLNLRERWEKRTAAPQAMLPRQNMAAAPMWSNIFTFGDPGFMDPATAAQIRALLERHIDWAYLIRAAHWHRM